MTDLMASITTGKTATGIRMVIAGLEKMGKTTLATGAPNALLVPLEVGFAAVSGPKTALVESLADFTNFLAACEHWASQKQFPFKTLVFDSATALERLIHDAVIRRDPLYKPNAGKNMITMDSAHGGYGKGYNLANEEFHYILSSCDRLATIWGINIVFTCHVFSSKMMDPTAGEYDSWNILLHSPKNEKTYGKRELLTQWADIVSFLHEPIYIMQNEGLRKATVQGKGRVLSLARSPSFVAGNRFNITEDISLPPPPANGWNAFANALYQKTQIDVWNREFL